MAGKPKSALATLMDSINSNEQSQSTTSTLDVAIPDVDMPTENSLASKDIGLPSYDAEREEVSTIPKLIQVDPRDCHLWKFADRPDAEVGDLQSLAVSMKSNGQQEPVLVRPNTQKTRHKYEVIFGSRRWRAAISVELPLQAIVKSVTDQEAALFQKEENENRKDLSDYARALSYKKQIDLGVFKSERELSKMLHISRQTLNDLMSYVRVPRQIIDAVPNYSEISRATALKLSLLSKDENLHSQLIYLGPRIGSKSVTASNIDFELNRKYLQTSKVEVHDIINSHGKKVGKLKQNPAGSISISIDARHAHRVDIDQLCKNISDMFDKERE